MTATLIFVGLAVLVPMLLALYAVIFVSGTISQQEERNDDRV